MRNRFPWIAALIYAALFTLLGAVRYNAHRNLVDFGIFAQTVASAYGCFCNTIEGSHWALHFSPILYLAGALVWLFAIRRGVVSGLLIAGGVGLLLALSGIGV